MRIRSQFVSIVVNFLLYSLQAVQIENIIVIANVASEL